MSSAWRLYSGLPESGGMMPSKKFLRAWTLACQRRYPAVANDSANFSTGPSTPYSSMVIMKLIWT